MISEGEFEKISRTGAANLETEFEIGQSYKPNKADWLDGVVGPRSADNQDEQCCGKTFGAG